MAHFISIVKPIFFGLWIFAIVALLPQQALAKLSDSLLQTVETEIKNLKALDILQLATQQSLKNLDLSIYYSEMALDLAKKENDLESSYRIYRERGFIYQENNHLRKSLREFENALTVVNQLDNDSHRLDTYTDLAISNRKLSNYKATTDYHTMALFLAQKNDDLLMVEYSYHGLGTLYELVGDFDKALEYYFQSLAIAEERKSTSGVVITLQNIANTYTKTDNSYQALETIERAYTLAGTTEDSLIIAEVLYDYGRVLHKAGKHSMALEKHLAGLEIYEKVGQKTSIVRSLIEISGIYTRMEKYNQAQAYFDLCFNDYKDYLSTKDNAHLYNKQAYLFQILDKTKKAEEAFLKGLDISIKHEYKVLSQENHFALYQIYRKNNETEKALSHLEASNKLLNYIQNNEKAQRIDEMQFQYEAEKRERKIQELQYSRNTVFYIGICLFLAIAAIFLFYTTGIKIKNNKALLKRNEEFEDQNRKLGESNQALSQFAYVAAHDLKEPLRNIGSFINLLQKRYGHQFGEEANGYMSYIKSGATRMNNLLVDLLEFSTLTTQEASDELINIRSVVSEVIGNLQTRIEEQKAIIKYPDKMPSVHMKRNHLVQVLQNLVCNSLKFVEGVPEVSIQYFPEPDHILLMVEDNGIGINKDYKNKVFLLFQQLEKNKGYGGTGIGLTICKSIVEKYNGQIWFESGLLQGTRFFIRLPLQENLDAPSNEQKNTKQGKRALSESYA